MLPHPERAWYHGGAAKTIDRSEVERRIGPTPEPIEALAGGLANTNVRIGRDRVLRVDDPSRLAKEASLLRRPWRALRTPAVLATGDDFLLLEFLELRPLPATAGGCGARARRDPRAHLSEDRRPRSRSIAGQALAG
ncbi:MAG TPA: hypothetical protein VK698_11260 [Kofleriaceae bacterium]|nr:hypothetical protein [Kofleriaceae bacterium]